jgi:hypothetical protein
MPEVADGIPLLRGGLLGIVTMATLAVGCAGPPRSDLVQRQAAVEAKISEVGLEHDARVEAARSELEAALAREQEEVLLDSVELRAAAVTEDETKMNALVRVPIGNSLALSAMKEARRADSRVALAKLSGAMIKSRVDLCMPLLRYESQVEDKKIFAKYAKQSRALLKWNEDLRESGLVNDMDWTLFKLSSRVRLASRAVPDAEAPITTLGLEGALGVLPDIENIAPPLDISVDVLREKLLVHQPDIEVHRAREDRYKALAKGEAMKRLPSVRFVDFGFEPVPYSGQERQYSARVAFEVPFGRESGAKMRRYEALAHAEVSDARRVLDDRVRTAKMAIDEVNFFREQSQHWKDLTALADSSELVAAEWWRSRRATPKDIAKLLDTVYAARVTVLKARDRAGAAVCALLSATGISISDW